MIRLRFPISLQISLFLVIVAFIPVAVMMMLHTYENQLLSFAEASNVQQARLMAASLAAKESTVIEAEDARRILQNMNGDFDARIRVLDSDGRLLADSSTLDTVSDEVQIADRGSAARSTPEASDNWIYHLLSTPIRIYRRHFRPPSISYSSADYYVGAAIYDGVEIQAAKAGRYGAATRISSGGQRSVTLYSAVPVSREGEVIGIVLVSRSTYRILQNLYELRLDLGKVFLLSLVVVIVIALFLVCRVSVPLKRLSRQTTACADKKGRIISTKFTGRKRLDEIGDLSRSFTALIEKLNARIRYTEAFSADVSHEFKNPLAAIRSSAELLADEGTGDSERMQFTTAILDEVTHLQTLLSGVRRISQIDGGSTEEEAEYIPVEPFIKNIITRLQWHYPAADISFRAKCGTASIRINPEHFDRLLDNIIGNAASLAGKVLVTAELQDSRGKQGRSRFLCIIIEDNGKGVPPEEAEKIFTRFYSNREDGHGHTGLGLSIVKAIVDVAGGTINVGKSPALGGAMFTVTLPNLQGLK